MNAEFNWWLLIVGLVVGAGLVWFVLMDARRREIDVEAAERRREAAWLSATLAGDGWDVPPDAAERLLDLHRAYLEAPPPDPVADGSAAFHEDDVGAPPDERDVVVEPPPPPADPGEVRRTTRPRRLRAAAAPATSEGAGEDGVGGRS